MNTATVRAGAKVQSSTGQWATLKTDQTVKVISESYGVYKVLLNGKQFSIDYSYVEIHA